MYCRAKPFREENHKPRKSHRSTPSFSSTLLDEIYRSVDGGNADKADAEDSTAHREKLRSNNGGGRRNTTGDNNEKAAAAAARFPRGCLVRNNDKDLLSSFGSTAAKSEVSRPHHNTNPNHNKPVGRMEEDCHQLTKSKSRALKVYTKLKKMKQPISPGKRLTNFINSLFTNLNSKKLKKQDLLQQQSPKVLSSSTPSSTYSSSFSTPSSITDKNKVMTMRNNNNDQKHYGRPPLPPNASVNHRNITRRESDFSMFEKVHDEEDDDDDDDDGVSDSSSDLFELDHLVLFGNNDILCQELPVYETTYFDKNRAVATGLF